MKLLITLSCLTSTIFAHSFDRENTFFYEPALGTQISALVVMVWPLNVGGFAVHRTGYHYNISDDFYEPISTSI